MHFPHDSQFDMLYFDMKYRKQGNQIIPTAAFALSSEFIHSVWSIKGLSLQTAAHNSKIHGSTSSPPAEAHFTMSWSKRARRSSWRGAIPTMNLMMILKTMAAATSAVACTSVELSNGPGLSGRRPEILWSRGGILGCLIRGESSLQPSSGWQSR